LTILKLSLAKDAKVAALKGLLVVEKDKRILQVFSQKWDTGKRWQRLVDRLEALNIESD
jgi:alkyl hydroperoxide reductase subunit AhpC